MKTIKNIALGVVVFALFACDHPFKAGLGPVEDIRPPTVTLVTPGAGEYIRDETTFIGTAEDDYKLALVEIKQVNYTGNNALGEPYPLQEYVPVNLEIKVNKGNWSYTIDTREFPDGDFKIQLRVTDSVNKFAETDPIVFLINNSFPAINISSPYVARGSEPGEVGNGEHLNYGVVGVLPNYMTFPRQMDKGGFITGTISHDEDIYTGPEIPAENPAESRYPPQIRVWRIEDVPVEGSSWAPGVLPPLSALPWERLTPEPIGIGSYMFLRDLPDAAGYFYGFEVRAQTKDGRSPFRYPRDMYPPQDPERKWELNGDFERENRYVLIYVRQPQELPTIGLYDREDILGETGPLKDPYNLMTFPDNHPYVNRETVNKNGDFILRVKATHPEGISTAEVYWEKDDRSERGRFIWDLANTAPTPALEGHTVAATRPYSEWGYRDPYSREGDYYKTRNFIYTYRQPTDSSGRDIRNYTQGDLSSPKIQKYNGNVEDEVEGGKVTKLGWRNGKASATWPTTTFAAGTWTPLDELSEGAYLIEVYAKSAYGTVLTVPLTCNVRLDRKGPEVKITIIDGVTDINNKNEAGEVLVNGVIRPRLNISDDRVQDSGHRPAPGNYYTPGRFEQRYIVVSADDNVEFAKKISNAWWPDPVKDSELGINIPSEGPVVDSAFTFKTSKIYDRGDAELDDIDLVDPKYPTHTLSLNGPKLNENDTLKNGSYVLYVFARDNAFNVGHTSLPIKVDHLSDFPDFDFSVGTTVRDKVTDPNVSADGEPHGFRQGNTVQNSMGSGTAIAFRLWDDDSLDLGTDGDDSSVTIEFSGSYRHPTEKDDKGNPKIRASADPETYSVDGNDFFMGPDYNMKVDADVVKKIFTPQQLDPEALGDRRAVLQRTGNIDQRILLDLLKTNTHYDNMFPLGKENYTSLPDGIYRLTLTAADYAPAKLIGKNDTVTAATAKKTVQFWVAVDSIAPVVGNISPVTGTYIGTGTSQITGTVSDQNGPITGRLVGVRNETTNAAVPATLSGPMIWEPVSRNPQWQDTFTANIAMPSNITAGTFIFTLEFADRFNNISTVELRYNMDEEAPTVTPLTPIKTFSRELRSQGYDPYPEIPDVDFTRLVNGVISFAFTAKDNLNVKEARWWLIPASAPAPVFNTNAYGVGAIADTDANKTMPITVTVGGNNLAAKGGRLTDNFSNKTWYVNTGGLADGRYTLYAAAQDGANKISDMVALQTIYVLKDEDKPWFGAASNITPNRGSGGQGAVSSTGAIVRGSIYEDDGFFELNSNNVFADSVVIYMSKSATAGGIVNDNSFDTGTLSSAFGYTAGIKLPNPTYPEAIIIRAQSSNNLNLNINLSKIAVFNDVMDGDGIKHYIIEAWDSPTGKFNTDESGSAAPADERQMRRAYFSFVSDSKDPVIMVSSTSSLKSGATFGKDPASPLSPFSLTASITDAYLDTLPNGNYYISWQLNNSGTYKTIDLGITGDGTNSTTGITNINHTVTGGERTITFTIPAAVLAPEIGYFVKPDGTISLASDSHNLIFQVKDESNKTGIAPVNFLIDTDAPSITFNTINGVQLPPVNINSVASPWWNVAYTSAGFQAKRTALESMPTKLLVVPYDGDTVTIKGSFVDTHSNIADTFYYSLDDKDDWISVTLSGEASKNRSWTIDIPASKLPDGVHSISIRVADVGGNQTDPGTVAAPNKPSVYYGFIVVSQRPTIRITSKVDLVIGDRKTTGATINNTDTVFTVSGNASSASLSDVKLKITYTDAVGVPAWNIASLAALVPTLFASNTLTYPTTQAAAYMETGNWTYNIPRSALYTAGGNAGTDFRSGNYELSAIAVDKGGSESDEALLPFIIDAVKPTFEFTTPANKDPTAPGTVRPASYWVGRSDQNVIMSPEPKLQISISDDNSLEAARYQIRRFNYTTNAWGTYFNGITGGVATWVTAETWRLIDSVSGTDFAWALDIKDLPDGYYYVRLQAADSSLISNPAPAITAINWSNTGAGNPGTSDYGYFFLSRTPPQLKHVDADKKQFSSKVLSDNRLRFKVNATDLTWFQSLRVEVKDPTKTSPSDILNLPITYPNPNYLYSTGTGEWEPEVSIQFPTTLADGMYDITFTVTNIAGRPNSISRTITLDNTAPEGTVDAPQTMNVPDYLALNPYPYNNPATTPASRISAGPGTTIYGGEEEAKLSGTTQDKSDNGSASGVAEIWYHLGYVGNAANNTPTGPLTFPTETAVRGTVSNLTLIDGRDLGGPANNALFDTAAKSLTTAWFKYDPAAEYPRPHGVESIGSDKINWELVIKRDLAKGTEIANYAKAGFTLKTGSATRYNNANGAWMVKQINPAGLPASVRKTGLYSMPLWIRVADTAGNVRYFCKDIWLYPNGDYPSNTFRSPAENQPRGPESKGGQFSIQGDASDNISVQKVIYRVKADNVSSESGTPTYNANWETVVPADDKIVRLTGVDLTPSEEFTSIPDYGNFTPNSNPFGTGAGKLSTTGWYYATLEAGSAPTMPWSIIVNAQNEITDTVMTAESTANRWFEFPAGSGVRYTRLYVEVFVFDSDANGRYNKISLGSDGVPATPKPDILVLYMTSSAPKIDNLKISRKDGSFDNKNGNALVAGDFSDYNSISNQNERLRSRRFAVQMTLDGSTRNLSLIDVRRYEKGAAVPDWTNIWETGNSFTNVTMTGGNTGIHLNGANATSITMTYAFDSLITTATNNYATILNGNWANTGGTYVIEVRIEDSNNPVRGSASTRFEIGIDNFAPVADTVKNITNTKVAGSNVSFLGRAFDYSLATTAGSSAIPNYRSIEKVYAWFTQDNTGTGRYINMETGAVSATVATDSRPVWNGRTATINWGADANANNVTSIEVNSVGTRTNVYYPTASGYYKELSAEIGGILTNRVNWQMNNNNPADIYWSFIANTANMPDGWMYLNYLVIDDAGNATSYQQHMMVRNNYPEITGVTLFTDNRGEGAAFTTHDQNDPNASSYYSVNNGTGTGVYKAVGRTPADFGKDLGYLNSGFISKNQAIGFEVETIKGNGKLNYRMQYVQRKSVALDNAILKNMVDKTYGGAIGNINLYTIKEKGDISNANWNLLGVKESSPEPGNHFVCASLDAATITALTLTNAEVWCYTMPGPTTGTNMLVKTDMDTGNTASADKLRFFSGPAAQGGGEFFNVGTISDRIPEMLGSRPEETTYDDPTKTAFFIIKVWDTVYLENSTGVTPQTDVTQFKEEEHQLYDVVVIGMNVYLSDHTNPTIRLYDLNPYTELSVAGSNSNDIMKDRTMEGAAYPTAIDANILRGGLFNVNTNPAPIRSGYIEPRDNSTALQPWIKDAYSGTYIQQDANGYVGTPGNGYSADAVGTGTAIDRVSGRIIIRGKAWDDQLIDEIRVRVDTTRPDATNGTTGFTTILKLQEVSGTNQIVSYNGARAWAVEEMHWKTGHTVEWAYILDTEVYNLGSSYITVIVKDKNGTGGGLLNGDPTGATNIDGSLNNYLPILIGSENRTNDRFHNQIQVTITPYVVGFARADEYATNRSLQGWYSFFRGEEGIRLLGYNLGGTADTTTNAPTMYIRHGAGTGATNATAIGAGAVTNGAASNFAPRRYTFNMPAGAQSGRIEVTTAAGPVAYNHTSVHASRSWNREANANISSSGLWVNKPYAHIWRTDADNTAPRTYFGGLTTGTAGNDSGGPISTGMALEYANGAGDNPGRLHAVWTSFGYATYYYGHNGSDTRTAMQTAPSGDPFGETDISIHNGTISGTGNNPNISVVYQNDGAPYVALRTDLRTNGAANAEHASARISEIAGTGNNRASERWRNTRIAKAAANTAADNNTATTATFYPGRVYLTAYDSQNKNLWFGMRYNSGANNAHTNYTRIIDGATGVVDGTTPITVTAASVAASANKGEFSAVDYDNNGPVIAYYDQENDTIRIAFGTLVTGDYPSLNANWTRRELLPRTHALYRGSGTYVSIKVDSTNRIHLAFYNSTYKTLVYANLTRNTTAANGVDEVYTIDNIVEGGIWTDISVDGSGNPWIVYGDISRKGNTDGARLAYKSSATTGIAFNSGTANQNRLRCPVTNADISTWEAVTMPAQYTIKDDRLNIEAWPPTVRGGNLGAAPGWNAAIGYASDRYRIGYFINPAWRDTGVTW